MGSILTYEARLAANAVRASLTSWPDRITIIILACGGAIFLYEWTIRIPDHGNEPLATAIGFLVAYATTTYALGRLQYHRTDGPLVHKAWEPIHAAKYLFVITAGPIALAIALAIGAGLAIPIAAAIAGIGFAFAHAFIKAKLSNWRSIADVVTFLRRASSPSLPRTSAFGLSMAAFLWIAANHAESGSVLVFLACIVVLVSITLSGTDAKAVRFKSQVGHSPNRLLLAFLVPFVAFMIPILGAVFLSFPVRIASAMAAIALIFAALVALRLLICQIYSASTASRLVFAICAMLAIVGALTPPAALVIFVVLFTRFHRQASKMPWKLP